MCSGGLSPWGIQSCPLFLLEKGMMRPHTANHPSTPFNRRTRYKYQKESEAGFVRDFALLSEWQADRILKLQSWSLSQPLGYGNAAFLPVISRGVGFKVTLHQHFTRLPLSCRRCSWKQKGTASTWTNLRLKDLFFSQKWSQPGRRRIGSLY